MEEIVAVQIQHQSHALDHCCESDMFSMKLMHIHDKGRTTCRPNFSTFGVRVDADSGGARSTVAITGGITEARDRTIGYG